MLSSDAKVIAKKQSSSSAIQNALNPSRGIRDDISRRGGTPKNHVRENATKLRQMQALNKVKKEEAEVATARKLDEKERSRARKMENVPSRLYDSRKPSAELPSPRLSTSTTLSASSLSRSDSSPSLNVSQNMPLRKTAVGQIPKYLVDRKCQWAATEDERQRKKVEEDTWPAGTIPVPEEERLQTLVYLKQNQATLMSELARFPITLQPSNVSRYQRKQVVEEKLGEIEKGIAVYSQARVFMQRPE